MMFGKLQTVRPQCGARQRWKDCIQHDLRFMELEAGWSSLACQRDKWHAATRDAVSKWEKAKNLKEQTDYEQKKAGVGVKCPRCDFVAKNERGLKSHFGQKHKFVMEDDSSEDDSSEEDSSEDDSSEEDSSEEDSSEEEEAKATCKSRSSSSSSSPASGSLKKEYICPNEKCKQVCKSGAGLARHLRCKAACKAVADRAKKGKEKK